MAYANDHLRFLPCSNITLTLEVTGLAGISRLECGSLCLAAGNCKAFIYNATGCFKEDANLVDEVLVSLSDGCFATKGTSVEQGPTFHPCFMLLLGKYLERSSHI